MFNSKANQVNNNTTELKYDVAIIGAGQTGLTLAKHLIKNEFNVLIIDKEEPGIKTSLDLKNFNKLVHRMDFSKISKIDFIESLSQRLIHINQEQNKELLSQLEKNSNFHFVKANIEMIEEYSLIANKQQYRFKKLVFATGSYYEEPKNYPNLKRNMYFNLDEIKKLDKLYKSIAIYGTNLEALELANAFAALDIDVYLFDENVNPFNDFDDELEAMLKTSFKPNKIHWCLESKIKNHLFVSDTSIRIEYESQGNYKYLEVEKIFIADNKVSSTKDIISKYEIPRNKKGSFIINNMYRIKGNPNFYAIGDANGLQMNPSQANYQAIQLVSIFSGEKATRYNPYNISIVIDIEPEFAFYGLNKHDLEYLNIDFNEFIFNFDYELNSKLFGYNSKLKVYTNKRHEILGVFLYGHKISELLSLFISIMMTKTKFYKLANMNFPFYSRSEAVRDAAAEYKLEFVGLSKKLKKIQNKNIKKER